MASTQSTHPPVVRLGGRAQAELRAGEALVFDWTRLAFCCAVAGEVNLRPTTLQEAQRSSAYLPLPSENGPLVFAHRRAYPMLVGRDIEVDCRRRLGVRSFSSSLPPTSGQATMSVMLAAADLGIGSAHADVYDQELARPYWALPRTGSAPCWSPWASPPTAHSRRSSGPTGARSTTSCTAATGSGRIRWSLPSGPTRRAGGC